jgi:hypothetical protein
MAAASMSKDNSIAAEPSKGIDILDCAEGCGFDA